MKKYMLPEAELVELRLNERIAADECDEGSMPNPPPGVVPTKEDEDVIPS